MTDDLLDWADLAALAHVTRNTRNTVAYTYNCCPAMCLAAASAIRYGAEMAEREMLTRGPFYSIGLDHEFEEHTSLAEAKRTAEHWLTDARGDESWPEYTGSIEYGRLVPIECAVERNYVAAKDDETGRCKANGWAHICDYRLEPVR